MKVIWAHVKKVGDIQGCQHCHRLSGVSLNEIFHMIHVEEESALSRDLGLCGEGVSTCQL